MHSEDLYYFLTVAAEGSVSAASRRLHIAQPALSKRMQALERELGCVLFIRGSRRISLTEAGEALRGRAEWDLSRMTDDMLAHIRAKLGAE